MAAIAAAQHFMCSAQLAIKAAGGETPILYACADFM
jgi:hypothetical protein